MDGEADIRLTESRGALSVGMFRGPARLAPLLPLLRAIPAPMARGLLVGLAIGDACCRPARLRRVRAWAHAQVSGAWAAERLALQVVATHGRFVADEAMIGVDSLDALAHSVVVEGAEHLRACRSGALLLGFHLGPPHGWVALRAAGFPVRLAARLEHLETDPAWAAAMAAGTVISFSSDASASRAQGLLHLRRILDDGGLVFLTADGPFGTELMTLPLPGGPLVVRRGWHALRAITRVPTLPVLTHQDGGRRIVVISPPLPAPSGDKHEDLRRCGDTLLALVSDYVRRFPSQCRWLAMPLEVGGRDKNTKLE